MHASQHSSPVRRRVQVPQIESLQIQKQMRGSTIRRFAGRLVSSAAYLAPPARAFTFTHSAKPGAAQNLARPS